MFTYGEKNSAYDTWTTGENEVQNIVISIG